MQLPVFIPAIAPRTIKERDSPLCHTFQPGSYDVICQRGRQPYKHIGNRRFRVMIENHVSRYANAPTKVDKSLLVISIVDTIRQLSPNGGFVRFCKKQKRYVEIGDHLAREKVGHALRDIMNGKKKSKTSMDMEYVIKQKTLKGIKSSAGSTKAAPFTAADHFQNNIPSSSSAAEQQIEPSSACCHEPWPLSAMGAFTSDMNKQQCEPTALDQMQLSSQSASLSNLQNAQRGAEVFRSINLSAFEDDKDHEEKNIWGKSFDAFQF